MVNQIMNAPCAVIFTRQQWGDILQMLRYCEKKVTSERDRLAIQGFISKIESTVYAVADDYDI